MFGASVENKLLVRVDLLKNPLPLGMGSRQEYNSIGADCCSYASTNVALQYAYENIDMSLRISTTSMANLSTKLFFKYKFDMIRIVREKKPSIDIFYDVSTGKIECDRYDGEIKMEYNLFDMWQNGMMTLEDMLSERIHLYYCDKFHLPKLKMYKNTAIKLRKQHEDWFKFKLINLEPNQMNRAIVILTCLGCDVIEISLNEKDLDLEESDIGVVLI